MAAYYNEFDPFAASWLRELIRQGYIADGEVDERSIKDVRPEELKGFSQCHFFAGIGGWSFALRLAGIPDNAPVWTGSCPCQAFSSAGKQLGFSDERHLWPTFFKLIEACKPAAVFGEQVAAAIRHGWLDLVESDLQHAGYAFGSAVLSGASIGAPHIRNRIFWGGGCVADATSDGRYVQNPLPQLFAVAGRRLDDPGDSSQGMEHADRIGLRGRSAEEGARGPGELPFRHEKPLPLPSRFWEHCEWRRGADGKTRPVEPLAFPLAYGIPARVGRLRGYGNAIIPQVGQVFVEEFLRALAEYQQRS